MIMIMISLSLIVISDNDISISIISLSLSLIVNMISDNTVKSQISAAALISFESFLGYNG